MGREHFGIDIGNSTSAGIVFVQVAELDGKYCSLYLVDAAVEALHVAMVFGLHTVVAQAAYDVGQSVIVCRDSSRIAQGSEIFSRIEAMPSCISERARALFSKNRPVCLGIVLNQL